CKGTKHRAFGAPVLESCRAEVAGWRSMRAVQHSSRSHERPANIVFLRALIDENPVTAPVCEKKDRGSGVQPRADCSNALIVVGSCGGRVLKGINPGGKNLVPHLRQRGGRNPSQKLIGNRYHRHWSRV